MDWICIKVWGIGGELDLHVRMGGEDLGTGMQGGGHRVGSHGNTC